MTDLILSTYEIEGNIGSGGSGIIYLANHKRLGKKVVLKADKRRLTRAQEVLRREVDALKNLNHTYIPQVYDYIIDSIDGDMVYTVMDYIEGESLNKPLRRGEVFGQPQVIKWATQLLEALRYLHSPTHGTPPHGIVHSDIKPSNIMRTPYGDICLIDYNIALALGEENAVGRTDGYSSPEHYGLDYSSSSGSETDTGDGEGGSTDLLDDATATLDSHAVKIDSPHVKSDSHAAKSHSSSKKRVIPDVRSDIYSLGATLYHLLTGRRPEKDAKDVVPLSNKDFSPQIVHIITKAMNPNPDLRWQTADEMLDAFMNLRANDPRTKRHKRVKIAVTILLAALFVSGAFTGFVGLKRMEARQNMLVLAEYSGNALRTGNIAAAIDYALLALPEKRDIFTPPVTAEAQKALTDALKIYDLSDGYKKYLSIELPTSPLFLEISPDGNTAAAVCANEVVIFDTHRAGIIARLPAERSALAEARYLDEDIIIFAGDGAVTAYDIILGDILWTGGPATSISLSADSKYAAAVYKDDGFATVYETENGQVVHTIDFDGKRQRIAVNDIFANPNDNLFALNGDGTLLGASFADGSLWVYDLRDREGDVEIFDDTSGYTHFEGGFSGIYFALSATKPSESLFAVIDMAELEQAGGFESDQPFGVQADESGIYVQTENILVKILPETGEQVPLVTTPEGIIRFARGSGHTLTTSKNEHMFFDANANLISRHDKEYGCDFVQIVAGVVLIGSLDAPVVQIMKYENHFYADYLAYDPEYIHDEARINADGDTMMLFSFDRFRIYGVDEEVIADVSIPDADRLYDQQFRRDDNGSRLEVIYNDGTIRAYSADDGSVLYETAGAAPDLTLYEEFYTDALRITSPLHGTPEAYDIKTGAFIRELERDAYLTYVTQADGYVVTQYITVDGDFYGLLLNDRCETLAYLPYLCDVIEDMLIFDYPTGNLRTSRIYNIQELIGIAKSSN